MIINVVKVNNFTYNEYLKKKNYNLILTGNIVSASPNLETYFGEGNLANYSNDRINEILKEVKNIEDTEILKEKYLELERIYKEELPFICLYSNSLFIITNKNLKGNLSCNWYNLFYNIDGWYKEK